MTVRKDLGCWMWFHVMTQSCDDMDITYGRLSLHYDEMAEETVFVQNFQNIMNIFQYLQHVSYRARWWVKLVIPQLDDVATFVSVLHLHLLFLFRQNIDGLVHGCSNSSALAMELIPTYIELPIYWRIYCKQKTNTTLQWYHNERLVVSNDQPHDCLLIFRRRLKKHQSSASLALMRGINQWPVNYPHKGSVTRKMFPSDDVIMRLKQDTSWRATSSLWRWNMNSY